MNSTDDDDSNTDADYQNDDSIRCQADSKSVSRKSPSKMEVDDFDRRNRVSDVEERNNSPLERTNGCTLISVTQRRILSADEF